MPRHCASALALAQHLTAHPLVEWVRYPALAGDRYAALTAKYLPQGAGGIITFGIRSGRHSGAKAGERFIESVQFLSHLANIGDAKTLVIHPASTTHRQMEAADLVKAGVTPDMVRISVGIETLDDILWDIDQALGEAGKA
jgi:O-acetylhomoserine (thiol)-lyase